MPTRRTVASSVKFASAIQTALERELDAEIAIKKLKGQLYMAQRAKGKGSTDAWQIIAQDDDLIDAERELGEARITLDIARVRLRIFIAKQTVQKND